MRPSILEGGLRVYIYHCEAIYMGGRFESLHISLWGDLHGTEVLYSVHLSIVSMCEVIYTGGRSESTSINVWGHLYGKEIWQCTPIDVWGDLHNRRSESTSINVRGNLYRREVWESTSIVVSGDLTVYIYHCVRWSDSLHLSMCQVIYTRGRRSDMVYLNGEVLGFRRRAWHGQ